MKIEENLVIIDTAGEVRRLLAPFPGVAIRLQHLTLRDVVIIGLWSFDNGVQNVWRLVAMVRVFETMAKVRLWRW
jgi:hypothetical protein